MILKSTLVDILHQGFDSLQDNDITGKAMWTLYQFIMMLCMGSSRGATDNSEDESDTGIFKMKSSSADSLDGGGSSLGLKRQSSGNSSNAFLELNAATKLRNKLLNFLTSELKTAFTIGFLIYIPYIIIDLVVASVLMSMGMMMLPPIMVSLPFKILLFVLVDGWNLVVQSLVKSFH
mgnify:CR=1 FL=1